MALQLLSASGLWGRNRHQSRHDTIVCIDMRYTLGMDYADSLQLLSIWDDLHAIAALQGIVNRRAPQLYINYVETDGRCIDQYWWDKYRHEGEWLSGRPVLTVQSVEEAVRHFRPLLKGIVAYDGRVASTSNVASSIAGIEDLLPLRYDTSSTSLYHRLTQGDNPMMVRRWLVGEDGTPLFTGSGTIPGTSRPSSGSTKCDPYLWLIEHYMKTGRMDGRYAGYYQDQQWRLRPGNAPRNHHTLTNHDFFISRRGFFFDLSPWPDEATDDPSQPQGTDHATLCELLAESHRLRKGKVPCYIGGFPSWAYKYTRHVGGRHEDVATEWQFAELISHYLAFKDADAIGYGALANASFWQHFPTKQRYTQQWTDRRELQEKGLLDQQGRVDTTRNYVIIYVGDYDASSWVSQRTPDLWDDPQRGKLPMMWCISPVLAERVPHILHNFRATASANDYFAAADNGAGYLMPGIVEQTSLRDLKAWERHCRRYYRKWGLSITGFIIDGNGPALGEAGLDAYARFSPDGIVPQKAPVSGIHRGMPILRSDFDLTPGDPHEAARVLVERVKDRKGTCFHWFRIILRSPQWYVAMMEEAQRLDPSIKLLDAPSFFEMLRQSNTPR